MWLLQILEQCDALLMYSVTPEHGGHVDLKVTRMNFRVAIGESPYCVFNTEVTLFTIVLV